MRRAGVLRALLAAAALAIAPALVFALEEQSLLTPDGTLHVLRAGKAIDLGLAEARPESILIEHATRAQDGTETVAILPGSESYQDKRGLQLGYDEETRTLLLLWTEDISAYSHIRVGVFRDGVWSNSALLPSQGISRAYNPEMRVTHQRVTYLDETDAVVAKTSSIVSVVWWEEATLLQARFAALFLDEGAPAPAFVAFGHCRVRTRAENCRWSLSCTAPEAPPNASLPWSGSSASRLRNASSWYTPTRSRNTGTICAASRNGPHTSAISTMWASSPR